MMSVIEKYIAWRQYDAMCNQVKSPRGTFIPGAVRWSGLFDSSIQASGAMTVFGEKLKGLNRSFDEVSIDLKKWCEEIDELGRQNELIASMHSSNLVERLRFYKSVSPWLRFAEELPNWRKELAKNAFNVKYHG